MDKGEAIGATRGGAIAALISATMTAFVVVVAMVSDASGSLAIWNDPLNLIDVLLILACAFGMYRKSRAASVLIFVYFVAAKIYISLETQAYAGLGIAVIFLYFYAKAIQGAFVFHRLEKENDPGYKATSKWSYIIGVPSALLVMILVTVALMSVTGVIPSTRVQAGNEVRDSEVSILLENAVIYPEDKIEYFYSQGLTSVLESGNILTSDRVILYFAGEDQEIEIYEIPFDEITGVDMESQGDVFNDSVYKVTTSDPDIWLQLILSTEQKGDKKFVSALRKNLLN